MSGPNNSNSVGNPAATNTQAQPAPAGAIVDNAPTTVGSQEVMPGQNTAPERPISRKRNSSIVAYVQDQGMLVEDMSNDQWEWAEKLKKICSFVPKWERHEVIIDFVTKPRMSGEVLGRIESLLAIGKTADLSPDELFELASDPDLSGEILGRMKSLKDIGSFHFLPLKKLLKLATDPKFAAKPEFFTVVLDRMKKLKDIKSYDSLTFDRLKNIFDLAKHDRMSETVLGWMEKLKDIGFWGSLDEFFEHATHERMSPQAMDWIEKLHDAFRRSFDLKGFVDVVTDTSMSSTVLHRIIKLNEIGKNDCLSLDELFELAKHDDFSKDILRRMVRLKAIGYYGRLSLDELREIFILATRDGMSGDVINRVQKLKNLTFYGDSLVDSLKNIRLEDFVNVAMKKDMSDALVERMEKLRAIKSYVTVSLEDLYVFATCEGMFDHVVDWVVRLKKIECYGLPLKEIINVATDSGMSTEVLNKMEKLSATKSCRLRLNELFEFAKKHELSKEVMDKMITLDGVKPGDDLSDLITSAKRDDLSEEVLRRMKRIKPLGSHLSLKEHIEFAKSVDVPEEVLNRMKKLDGLGTYPSLEKLYSFATDPDVTYAVDWMKRLKAIRPNQWFTLQDLISLVQSGGMSEEVIGRIERLKATGLYRSYSLRKLLAFAKTVDLSEELMDGMKMLKTFELYAPLEELFEAAMRKGMSAELKGRMERIKAFGLYKLPNKLFTSDMRNSISDKVLVWVESLEEIRTRDTSLEDVFKVATRDNMSDQLVDRIKGLRKVYPDSRIDNLADVATYPNLAGDVRNKMVTLSRLGLHTKPAELYGLATNKKLTTKLLSKMEELNKDRSQEISLEDLFEQALNTREKKTWRISFVFNIGQSLLRRLTRARFAGASNS